MLKSYKYRLIPNKEQEAKLIYHFNCCRFVYNIALEVKKTAWESAKVNLSSYDLMKQLTELKNTECLWLKECYAISLESAITNLDSAYKSFFRKGGYPKFKNKHSQQSCQFRQGTKVSGDTVYLPKVGWVKIIKHRDMEEGQIRTVTASKTTTGAYYVSILIKTPNSEPDKALITPNTTVGLDVGLKSFAALSDGQIIENNKFLEKQLSRLRKEQRTLARRFKKGAKEQSIGYHKQKLVVAKLHEKIRNQRSDFIHKASNYLVTNYNTICVEDLNIAGMVKNSTLSRAIHDVGWNELVRQLKYKADWNGKNVVTIGRFQPSSKTCSSCGSINQELKLAHREWTCSDCGVLHDRDLNAAINIKNMGLRQSLHSSM